MRTLLFSFLISGLVDLCSNFKEERETINTGGGGGIKVDGASPVFAYNDQIISRSKPFNISIFHKGTVCLKCLLMY
jgi:hypothetical protein